MNPPQILLLLLVAFNLITHICNHNTERPNYNGPLAFLDAVATIALLYWGGFFDSCLH